MRRNTANHGRQGAFRSLIGAVVAIGLLTGATSAHADFNPPANRAPGKIDDGWRKTATGWEHVSTWDQPPVLASHVVLVTDRNYLEATKHDLHPLAWALLMLFISLASLTFLPGSQPQRLDELVDD